MDNNVNEKVIAKIVSILGFNYNINEITSENVIPFLKYGFIDGSINEIYRLVNLPNVYWIYKQDSDGKEILYALDMQDNTLQIHEI